MASLSDLAKFIKNCSGKNQTEILKLFLYTLLEVNQVSDLGSILLYNPATDKLYLWNEDDFLFVRGYLDKNQRWQETFDRWEGIAGVAFAKKETVIVGNTDADDRFRRGSPIKSMICVPIIFSGQKEPFGVVSFHNDSLDEQFDADTIELIEAYVIVLAKELKHARPPAGRPNNVRVFIVHGHDELALAQLKSLLLESKLVPVVLKEIPRTGTHILVKLEEEIGKCTAGFVLLTPDDLGRSQTDKKDKLVPRARQNVIFESGYLTAQFRDARRVCFLVQEPVDMPSDLDGLLYHTFDSIDKSTGTVLSVLKEWQLIPS
jgi:predicted nucleotide-binding protein